MKFFTRYSPPKSLPSFVGGRSMTRQEFAPDCDINRIIARVGLGTLAPLHSPEPVYTDLDAVPQDYEAAFAMIEDARSRFLALPSKVREFFRNDPGAMLSFLGDKSNREKAIELGLIVPPKVPSPDDVRSGKVVQENLVNA